MLKKNMLTIKAFVCCLMTAVLLAGCSPGSDVSQGGKQSGTASEKAPSNAESEKPEEISGEASEQTSEEVSEERPKEYQIIKRTRIGDVAVAIKTVRGKKHYALVVGEEPVTDFRADGYRLIGAEYIALFGSVGNELYDTEGNKIEREVYDVMSKIGDGMYSVRTKDYTYALITGGELLGNGVLLDGEFVTGYDYTEIKALRDVYSERVEGYFVTKKTDGEVEVRDYSGRKVISGDFSEPTAFFDVLRVKNSDGAYTFYGYDSSHGVKFVSVGGLVNYDLGAVRMYGAESDGGEYRWYVGVDNDGIFSLEEYDEKAAYDKHAEVLLNMVSRLEEAIKADVISPDISSLVSYDINKAYYDWTAGALHYERKEYTKDYIYDYMSKTKTSEPRVFALFCLAYKLKEYYMSYPDGFRALVYVIDEKNGVYAMSFPIPAEMYRDYTINLAYLKTKSDGRGGLIIDEIVRTDYSGGIWRFE